MEQLFRLSKMFLILKHAEDDKKYKKSARYSVNLLYVMKEF